MYRRQLELRMWCVLLLLLVLVEKTAWAIPQEAGLAQRNRELVAAVKRNDAVAVRALLKQGADPNTTEKQTQTLEPDNVPVLSLATGPSNERATDATPIVLALLEYGADPNRCYGKTPLEDAAFYNHLQQLTALLDKGANPNLVVRLLANGTLTRQQSNPVKAAIGNMATEDTEILRLLQPLMAHGADTNVKSVVLGETALMACAGGEDPLCAKLLLAHGADIDATDNKGWTALMHAARLGRTEAIQWLLADGAAVNIRDKQGKTALDLASSDPKIVQILLMAGAKGSPLPWYRPGNARTAALILAAGQEDVKAVQNFLAQGADVNGTDIRGNTPLHEAVIGYHTYKGDFTSYDLDRDKRFPPLQVVRLLVAKGATVNATNAREETPLMAALQRSSPLEIIAFLLQKGAKARGEDKSGETPMNIAAKWTQNPKVFALLIAHGAQVNERNYFQSTPLMQAAGSVQPGRVEAMQELLRLGAEVNAEDKTGNTALFSAMVAQDNSAPIVELLLAHGADVNHRNHLQHTVLKDARFFKPKDVLPLLEKAGATE